MEHFGHHHLAERAKHPALTSTNLGLGGNGPQYDTKTVDKTGKEVYNTYAINAEDYLGTNNSNPQPTVTCNPTANLKAHQYFNASLLLDSACGNKRSVAVAVYSRPGVLQQ